IISEVSYNETIDGNLHDIGPAEKAYREIYRDKHGINITRIKWEDGTLQEEKKISDDHKIRFIKWQNEVVSSYETFSNYPDDVILSSWIKDYFQDNLSFREFSKSSDSKKPSEVPGFSIDLLSFERKLYKTLSESKKVTEKRTYWIKDGIKQRECLYSPGIFEIVTNWTKTGIKEKRISDSSGDFRFSHVIRRDSFDSRVCQYKDICLEKSIDYEKNTLLWRYRRGDNLFEYCSLPSEDGNRMKYTKIIEEKTGNKRFALESDEGVKVVKLEEPHKKLRHITFPGNNIEIQLIIPGIERNTVISGNGAGRDIRKEDGKGEITTSWLSDKEILIYSRKYPGGLTNKCYFYNNNITRQSVSHENGNSYELLQLPGNLIKRVITYKNGTRESVTWFPEGNQRRTVRYVDNSLLSDLICNNGTMQKQGIKFSDGTCYLYKKWGNGISQQCFCWPDSNIAHLSTEFESHGLFDNKTIYPDGSYIKEIISERGKLTMKFSRDPLLENIYESSLQEILNSPLTGMKLRENPFYNPLLTLDPQLWAHAILRCRGPEKTRHDYLSEEKKVLPYMKMSFQFSFGEGM
ncbi:MAG TPA: hypothetical protein PL110_18225, partial [Candidatus Eremiobacteraeota bacterium]|nr:hypothetical protein [Candidatus Eremiobacteraeota bacterium]